MAGPEAFHADPFRDERFPGEGNAAIKGYGTFLGSGFLEELGELTLRTRSLQTRLTFRKRRGRPLSEVYLGAAEEAKGNGEGQKFFKAHESSPELPFGFRN